MIKWVDEIVVVDMYSDDETIKIAKKFTRNISTFNQSNFVEPARNYAINKATKDWILIIDSDEILTPNAELLIRLLVVNKEVDGYSFPRRAYVSSDTYLKHGYFYPDYQLRLFRNNGKIRYSGRIHEQPVIPKERTKIVKEVEIIHNTSRCKYDSFLHFFRFRNYIRIEGVEIGDSSVSSGRLLCLIPLDFLRHIYRSFVKLKGYKDGYPGLRAAIIFAMYKTSVYLYTLWYRTRRLLG